MSRLRQAFEANRSRWVAVLTPFVTTGVYQGALALGLPEDLADLLATAVVATATAYILGNGIYEAATDSSVNEAWGPVNPGQPATPPVAEEVDRSRIQPGA